MKTPERTPQRTPEEIKKGLECCMDYQSCTDCGEPKCPYNDMKECVAALLADALALIQQLETGLAAVKRERDAAVTALESIATGRESKCDHCVHKSDGCRSICWGTRWQWRGVCPQNTEVQEDDH